MPLGSSTVPPQNCRLRACRPLALGSHSTSDNVNPNTKLVCMFLCPVIMMILVAFSRWGAEAKRHSLEVVCVNWDDESFCGLQYVSWWDLVRLVSQCWESKR
ncbi:hypothetical protein BU25DRAFT_269053 [Macroventuria anomochaeta]|uniref:Uncharacterized protein n=1 Tax=Macroventuria anomochaeta TaxID=301207 RepID=A0ACB6S7L8_9PLEO|nr:uncharacterized protein BU25DRAFT_269053 [Macroventuria anomochaeta]KAF2629560.1 hypothetical protein BU25DRAFT_269053 [Macroventuria anomochaeta]